MSAVRQYTPERALQERKVRWREVCSVQRILGAQRGAVGSEHVIEEIQPPEVGHGAYLPVEVADQAEAAEWVTFYPHDEHGCKWHVRGAEGDSTGRVHGSAPPRSVEAEVP